MHWAVEKVGYVTIVKCTLLKRNFISHTKSDYVVEAENEWYKYNLAKEKEIDLLMWHKGLGAI